MLTNTNVFPLRIKGFISHFFFPSRLSLNCLWVRAEIRCPWCTGCKSSSDPVTESLAARADGSGALPHSAARACSGVLTLGIIRRAPRACSSCTANQFQTTGRTSRVSMPVSAPALDGIRVGGRAHRARCASRCYRCTRRSACMLAGPRARSRQLAISNRRPAPTPCVARTGHLELPSPHDPSWAEAPTLGRSGGELQAALKPPRREVSRSPRSARVASRARDSH
jgi:hypothetical protein